MSKSGLHKLTHHLDEVTEDLERDARHAAKHLRKALRRSGRAVGEAGDSVRAVLRARPLAAVALAFGAAVLVGGMTVRAFCRGR